MQKIKLGISLVVLILLVTIMCPLSFSVSTHHNSVTYNNTVLPIQQQYLNQNGISAKLALVDIKLDITPLSTISGIGLTKRDGQLYSQVVINLGWTNALSTFTVLNLINISIKSHTGFTDGGIVIFYGTIERETRIAFTKYHFRGIAFVLDIEY